MCNWKAGCFLFHFIYIYNGAGNLPWSHRVVHLTFRIPAERKQSKMIFNFFRHTLQRNLWVPQSRRTFPLRPLAEAWATSAALELRRVGDEDLCGKRNFCPSTRHVANVQWGTRHSRAPILWPPHQAPAQLQQKRCWLIPRVFMMQLRRIQVLETTLCLSEAKKSL
jgi:hypothetical protein